MIRTHYPNFLKDPAEYSQVEAYWQEKWMTLLRSTGVQEDWQSPWINNSFANGTPCRDGNPIFSAICPSRHLGIRVIQYEPSENPREIYVWTDIFAEGEPEAVKELVISCVLTTETLYDCLDLMKLWMHSEEVRLSYISEFPISVGKPHLAKGNIFSFSVPPKRIVERRVELAAC